MAIMYNPMQDIGPALGNIAESVGRMINPFHDLQVAARNRIIQDPALAQKLSDLESTSPGTLETLGLGPIGKAIAKIPPSQAQYIENVMRPGLKNAATPQNVNIAATRALTGLLPSKATTEGAASDLLNKNPDVLQTAATEEATKMTPSELMLDKLKTGDIQGAQDFFKQHPNESVDDIYKGVMSGKMSLNDLKNMYALPDIGRGVSEAINARLRREDVLSNVALRTALRGDSINEVMERIRLSGAIQAARSVGTNNPQAMYKYMWGSPQVRQHAWDLVADPSKAVTQDDKDLLEAAQGVQRADAGKKMLQIGTASKNLQASIDHINNDAGKMDKDGLTANLQGAQRQLDAIAQFGGQHLTINYGDIPGKHAFLGMGHKTGLYFTNEAGQVVSPDRATSGEISPQISNVVNSVFNKYIQTPAARRGTFFDKGVDSAQVSQLKAIGTTPEEIKRLVLIRAGSLTPSTSVDTSEAQP